MTWRRAGTAGIALVVIVAIGLGWSSLLPSAAPVIVDGLSVGPLAACGACDGPPTVSCGECESVAAIARRELEADWPGHPPVVAWAFHGEGGYPGPSGETILSARSGTMIIGLAAFADGTRHAVPVHCGVGGCRDGR